MQHPNRTAGRTELLTQRPTSSAMKPATLPPRATCESAWNARRRDGDSALSLAEVLVIASGRAVPIRDLPPVHAVAEIERSIQRIAPVYGARKSVPADVVEACLEIALEHYGGLGLEEISLAYRLWAAGRIQALEMYGGEFNATQFGRVLHAYEAYRRGVKYALAQAESDERRQRRREEREERHARDYERLVAEFPQDVQLAREHDLFERPSAIPRTWYQLAERHGMIQYAKGEKLRLCQLAERQVEAEQRDQRAAARDHVALRTLNAHLASVGTTPIYERAKQYAVWTKVLGRKLPVQ